MVVTLNVQNVNDEVPYFTTKPTPFLAAIPETTDAAYKVFQLQAVDPDNGSVVYYMNHTQSKWWIQIIAGALYNTHNRWWQRFMKSHDYQGLRIELESCW